MCGGCCRDTVGLDAGWAVGFHFFEGESFA